jgi:hypothetical protein
MPIIKNNVSQQESTSTGAYGSFQDVSKTIWKNTVSLRANNEFAVFDFLVDRDQGDGSFYHPIAAKSSRTGNPFTKHVYCNERNVSTEGRLVEEECEPCSDVLSTEQKTYPRMRYTYWVLHYGTYHLDTNPDLQAQKAWTQSWKQVTVGKQTFFRETVLKPQLLILSQKTWNMIDLVEQRKGTILSTPDAPAHFEFRRSFQTNTGSSTGMVSYDILPSDISVPDLSEEATKIVSSLPSLDHIAAELIMELDLPQFGTPLATKEQEDTANAFDRMANIEKDGQF